MRKVYLIAAFALVLAAVFLPAPSIAGDNTLDEIVEGLQKNYREMKDYRAGFTQETKLKAYPRPQRSEGEVFYKKPGMMRWNYSKPERQEIITDAETVWMYTPSLRQVMKTDFSLTNQSRVASAFLSGMGNLREDFHVSLLEKGDADSGYSVKLVPKDKADSVKTLILTLDEKSFNIIRSELTDIYDNVTVVTFSAFRVNIGIDDRIFSFTPPEGVEVITPPAMP